jgi:hypothetical protein
MDNDWKRGLLDLILCLAILALICSASMDPNAEAESKSLHADSMIHTEETTSPEFTGTGASRFLPGAGTSVGAAGEHSGQP